MSNGKAFSGLDSMVRTTAVRDSNRQSMVDKKQLQAVRHYWREVALNARSKPLRAAQ
jgi:hypothetical protein